MAAELTEFNSADIVPRTDAVLSTIYLIFNEGFSASTGMTPTRNELCQEAIRLTRMLAGHPLCAHPAVVWRCRRVPPALRTVG